MDKNKQLKTVAQTYINMKLDEAKLKKTKKKDDDSDSVQLPTGIIARHEHEINEESPRFTPANVPENAMKKALAKVKEGKSNPDKPKQSEKLKEEAEMSAKLARKKAMLDSIRQRKKSSQNKKNLGETKKKKLDEYVMTGSTTHSAEGTPLPANVVARRQHRIKQIAAIARERSAKASELGKGYGVAADKAREAMLALTAKGAYVRPATGFDRGGREKHTGGIAAAGGEISKPGVGIEVGQSHITTGEREAAEAERVKMSAERRAGAETFKRSKQNTF